MLTAQRLPAQEEPGASERQLPKVKNDLDLDLYIDAYMLRHVYLSQFAPSADDLGGALAEAAPSIEATGRDKDDSQSTNSSPLRLFEDHDQAGGGQAASRMASPRREEEDLERGGGEVKPGVSAAALTADGSSEGAAVGQGTTSPAAATCDADVDKEAARNAMLASNKWVLSRAPGPRLTLASPFALSYQINISTRSSPPGCQPSSNLLATLCSIPGRRPSSSRQP